MKGKRIVVWIIALVATVFIIISYEHKKEVPTEEQKIMFNVYNDVEKESTVRKIFEDSKIVPKDQINFIENSKSAECIFTKNVERIKDDEDKAVLTSYTPLIIVLKNSSALQKYQNSGLLISSKSINNSPQDEISIDFKKVIDAVVNEENWSTFGGKEIDFKIIVPENDSVEGNIFESFLLATINGGSYPQTEKSLSDAKEIATDFLNSEKCVESENAINDLEKISAINETDMYILFEADLMNSTVWDEKKLDISIVYPSTTVVKHIYMQSEGAYKELFNTLSTDLNYRTSITHSFADNENYNVNDDIEFIEVPVEDTESDAIEVVFKIIVVILLFVLLICLLSLLLM